MPAELISRGLTPKHQLHGIRSLISFGRLCGPLGYSVLYLRKSNLRLALKLFRGEPAISKFDWNFSAIHKSSPPFSTDVWFGPPWNFTPTSTCSWIGHPVSGLRHATLFRPVQTRFPFGSRPSVLNLAAYCNSPVRSTKSTRSYLTCTFSACKHRVSGSLSLPSRGSFHLSLTVLCAIGRHPSLALGGGPPCFPPDFSCPAVLWYQLASSAFRLRDCYPLRSAFPDLFN